MSESRCRKIQAEFPTSPHLRANHTSAVLPGQAQRGLSNLVRLDRIVAGYPKGIILGIYGILLIHFASALIAKLLCRRAEKRTMRESESKSDNPAKETF